MEENNKENIEEVNAEQSVDVQPVEENQAPVEAAPVETAPVESTPVAEAAPAATEAQPEGSEPMVAEDKKGNKGLLVGGIIFAILAIGFLIVFLFPGILISKKAIVSKEAGLFFTEARKVLDKAEKNTLKYDFEKDAIGLSGNITFDSDYKDKDVDLTKLKDYSISYKGVIDKKGNQASVGLGLDGTKSIIDANAMMKGKEVFINLGDLYSKTLYTQTEQEVKDLEVSSVTVDDIRLLVNKTETVINENIKNEDITQEKVKQNASGKKGNFTKTAYKVDVNAYTEKLIEAYKSDSEVVDVLTRLSNSTEKEVKAQLDEALKEVKKAEKSTFDLNMYSSGLMSKSKEMEIVVDGEKIIIDVEGKVYNYKAVDSKGKEILSGVYDTAKQEFSFKAEDEGVKVEYSMKSENDNKITGKLSAVTGQDEVEATFEINNKISGKSADTTVTATVNVKGSQKFNFKVKADSKATVGAKVEDISTSNTVSIDKLSEQDMNNIYMKLMQKLQPIIMEVAPGAFAS